MLAFGCASGIRSPALIKQSPTLTDGQSVKPLDLPSAVHDGPGLTQIWSEWGRLSRFLESARLAFAREHDLWSSLELRAPADVKLSAATERGKYTVALREHLAAVRDEEMLLASVLIHSYALAENAAAERLGDDARDFDGIEDWGARLLATTGATWDDLNEGIAGAVEVAVVRNAYAHGTRRVDALAAKRLRAVGNTQQKAGDPVVLDYSTLRVFRGRLRALMRLGGVD